MALYAFDGTWNGPDTNSADLLDRNTNVFLFSESYAKAHGQDTTPLRSQYIKGVGTRFGKSGRIIGGLTGAGGRSRIKEMLKLCTQEIAAGDLVIDIIGFSRGAALALHFANKLSEEGIVGRGTQGSPTIRFLGLWDTVPAFGIPGAYLDVAKDLDVGWELDVPEHVGLCAHAMARHERRQAFDVHRIDAERKHPHVREVWFRGVHSDVGGGNGNSALNSIALRWMMEQARSIGVPFSSEQLADVMRLENPSAPVSANSHVGEEIDRTFHPKDVLHASAARRLKVGESKRVSVDSKLIFDFSGIIVEPGGRYLIAPDNKGRWKDKSIDCDSTGWPDKLNRSNHFLGIIKEGIMESHAIGLLRRVRKANWFELCMSVGFGGDDAVPVGKHQHSTSPWECRTGGPLNFFANDALRPINTYDNNEGSISVVVKRVS